MSESRGEVGIGGALSAKRITRADRLAAYARDARTWRLKNSVRKLIAGESIVPMVASAASAVRGVTAAFGTLSVAVLKADGTRVDYGVAGHHLITTAGKNYIASTFNSVAEPENLKFHGVGTGATAAAVGDTTLVTESTTALLVDSTRATGSQANSTNTYTTVGTVTFDASAAITEWGLFSQAATGGGTLLDRQVFSAVNVVSGDSIQFTYVLTIS
jgi:hypothetical protein